MNKMRSVTSIALNVQTLLESGCLSRHHFSVDSSEILEEPPHSQHQHHRDDDGIGNVGSNSGIDESNIDESNIDESNIDESQNTTSPLRILNAVKLSLMLTRAFAQCWNSNNNNDHNYMTDLGSLRLDDFIVKLLCSTSGGPGPAAGPAAGPDAAMDDVAIGEKDSCELSPRVVSEGSCCNCNLQLQGSCCKNLQTISTVDQFNAITSSDEKNIQWIILDVTVVKYSDNINPPTRSLRRIINIDNPRQNDNNTTNNIETLMQSFGKVLYAIFSPNNNDNDTATAALPSAVMSSSSNTQATQASSQDSTEIDKGKTPVTIVRNNGSSNKMRRKQSSSIKLLFELLLQLGHPISICRLLSDLLDNNSSNNSNYSQRGNTTNNISSSNNSKSNSNRISFHDITCELEQMISQPHLFLNNPEREFYNGGIHFGQQYYGREKELAKILDITTVYKEGRFGLETIFVSGMAGSGKSYLVSAVGSFVSSFGFMVLTAKFQRGMEYTSREIVSTLMDEMVSNLVAMKESENDSDIKYVNQVTSSLSNALDDDSLSALSGFVPSIQSLITPRVVVKKDNPSRCTTHWQLVFLLSKLLHSVLNNQEHIKIFLALDDLQWADPTTLGLINELLLSISKCPAERRRLVFVGMYRDGDDFVTEDLSAFMTSLDNLQQCDGSANVTQVKLSTLSLEDVTEMIMCELRLPKRLVRELADVVHKRTHGHAIFVVQLLNSLVSDSIVSYSPMLRRYYWDQDKVVKLKTADSVASLIVSNLTSLPSGELQCLRIISCFGIQVQSNFLELLDVVHGLAPQGGFRPYLGNLVNQGIIEMVVSSSSSSSNNSTTTTASSATVSKVSTLVVFTHDLIQEQVYEGIPINERQQLHCDIGIFLSSLTTLDKYANSIEVNPIDATIHQLDLDDYHASDTDYENIGDHSSLISNATSQINSAGPQFFFRSSSDPRQRTRFASWNLRAGKDAANSRSSFREALHYYKHGIDFLDSSDDDINLWGNRLLEIKDHHADTTDTADTALCLKLHEGAAFVSSALGESALVSMYTHEIIDNVKLEDSLVAEYLLIGSLSVSGRFKEAVERGLAVLRALKFEIPATPTPAVVMKMMKRTEREASMYNFSQISNHHRRRVDSKTRNILKLVDAMSGACYFIASPFLPLVACLTIRYSLQNGVCEETASALAIFAYFQVFLKKSFESGRLWGIVAKNMLEKASSEGPVTTVTTRARFMLFAFLNFWYVPLQESSNHIQDIEDMSFKFGDPEEAYMAQCMRVRFLFFRGERLSILSHTVDTNLQSMARFSIRSATFSVLNKEMIDSLTGDKSSNPYAIFNGKICNKQTLLADAQSKMNFQIVEAVHLQKFFISFWMGEYDEAAEASDSAKSFPCSKMPKVELPHHMFYRGIVAFQLYREGKGENWLKIGDEMREQVEIWVKNSKSIFENKLILLKAEQFASTCDVTAAKESYELSIKVARDNGYIHEQGLAYECMGIYLTSIVEVGEAERCFLSAHKCYMQWGAMAKADKLRKDWNLSSRIEIIEPSTTKHDRDE